MSILVRLFFTTFDVDYHDKSALMNLNLCLEIKHHPMALWNTALMNSIVDGGKKTRSVKVVQKQPHLSENIVAVRELIMQESHVTCREIEASLGISSTSIHSILHEHLGVKKICCRWIPHNLTNENLWNLMWLIEISNFSL